jgi:soluble lytic murein transglycosylase-like protein
MDKKITIQIISVEIIRFFFIFVMILGVSLVSIHSGQRDVRSGQRDVRGMKKISQISMPSISQPLADENAGGYSVYGALYGYMNKKEQLFHPIIIKVSSRHQIDPALVKAIIMAESGYNPKAISKRGAKGLMQLMPSTAQALGVEDVFNPKENISGGVRYFKQLVNNFDGDITLALAAYNAGSRNVRQYQGIPPFKSTRYYIEKVFKYYHLYKDKMSGKADSA